MKNCILLTAFVASLLGSVSATAQAGKPAAVDAALVGDWRGDSICTVRPSACHDEKALYRVKKQGKEPDRYAIDGYKIVDGKPEFMATIECTYAPQKHELACSTPVVLHLILSDKGLNGTMNKPD